MVHILHMPACMHRARTLAFAERCIHWHVHIFRSISVHIFLSSPNYYKPSYDGTRVHTVVGTRTKWVGPQISAPNWASRLHGPELLWLPGIHRPLGGVLEAESLPSTPEMLLPTLEGTNLCSLSVSHVPKKGMQVLSPCAWWKTPNLVPEPGTPKMPENLKYRQPDASGQAPLQGTHEADVDAQTTVPAKTCNMRCRLCRVQVGAAFPPPPSPPLLGSDRVSRRVHAPPFQTTRIGTFLVSRTYQTPPKLIPCSTPVLSVVRPQKQKLNMHNPWPVKFSLLPALLLQTPSPGRAGQAGIHWL